LVGGFWLLSFGRQLGNELAGERPGLPSASLQNYGLVLPEPDLTVDRVEYDRRVRQLAHLESVVPIPAVPAVPDSSSVAATPPPASSAWPAPAAAVYPQRGAILPFERIVAYYGNFYSRGMGVLGEYDEATVIRKLDAEVAAWEAADPTTPVRRAIDYVAIVAQAGPGRDGLYRLRMPDKEIDKALALAEKVDGIVILEVQPGFADVRDEVRSLEKYLRLPQVHLAVDPEFAMKRVGERPGLRVGTVNAAEINDIIDYLAGLVQAHALPPKVLVVHRYTRAMVTGAADIMPRPEVQVVIDMDGWGPPSQKYATYNAYIASEPVQFTGFKLFYKNDTKTGTPLLRPEQVLELKPRPIFIQYQ
jgi:hypothetical protein